MSFRWIYLDPAGGERGSSENFETQQEAEDWMGTQWRTLLDSGVLRVTLVDGDARLYRMKLTEE